MWEVPHEIDQNTYDKNFVWWGTFIVDELLLLFLFYKYKTYKHEEAQISSKAKYVLNMMGGSDDNISNSKIC